MEPSASASGLIFTAYMAGSVPFGLLFAKARGIDIQSAGSGNIGATNVARVLGKKLGVVVLLLDAAKGALPVFVASRLAAAQLVPAWCVLACALAAVAGHCFPVWLRFHGGKGVATSLGVFLVINAWAALASVGVFALVVAVSRAASLGSLAAAVAFPAILLLMGHTALDVGLAGIMALLIMFRHRDNITRLRKGNENRV